MEVAETNPKVRSLFRRIRACLRRIAEIRRKDMNMGAFSVVCRQAAKGCCLHRGGA